MSEEEQQRLFENTANEMAPVSDHIKHRHIRHCFKADTAYGEGVAKALGIDIKDVELDIVD